MVRRSPAGHNGLTPSSGFDGDSLRRRNNQARADDCLSVMPGTRLSSRLLSLQNPTRQMAGDLNSCLAGRTAEKLTTFLRLGWFLRRPLVLAGPVFALLVVIRASLGNRREGLQAKNRRSDIRGLLSEIPPGYVVLLHVDTPPLTYLNCALPPIRWQIKSRAWNWSSAASTPSLIDNYRN